MFRYLVLTLFTLGTLPVSFGTCDCGSGHDITGYYEQIAVGGKINVDPLNDCDCTQIDSASAAKVAAEACKFQRSEVGESGSVPKNWPVRDKRLLKLAASKRDDARKQIALRAHTIFANIYSSKDYPTISDCSVLLPKMYPWLNMDIYTAKRDDDPIDDKRIKRQYFTLNYPIGYFGNSKETEVPAERITICAAQGQHDIALIAYFVNYNKSRSQLGCKKGSCVIVSLNGHFDDKPGPQGNGGRHTSGSVLGLSYKGGISGAPVGRLATKGYAIITYDDPMINGYHRDGYQPHVGGESFRSATGYPEELLKPMLDHLWIIDHTLLRDTNGTNRFDRTDGMGISGGGERLLYFLLVDPSALRSAYVAGYAETNAQSDLNCTGTGEGCSPRINRSISWADAAVTGISSNVDVAFALNYHDGMDNKVALHGGLIPDVVPYVKNELYLGGDDPRGTNESKGHRYLHHEYDLQDYEWFLLQTRSSRSFRADLLNRFDLPSVSQCDVAQE